MGMPSGDAPSETCHGSEKPRPLAVSERTSSARRVVVDERRRAEQEVARAWWVTSLRRKMDVASEREVGLGREERRVVSFSVGFSEVVVC
jgi:hypothetical protein